MKKLEFSKVYEENGVKVIEFDHGRNIKKVTFTLNDTYKGGIFVRYAQNGITSNTILFAKTSDSSRNVDMTIAQAVSATHIFIHTPDGVEPQNICIFEEDEDNITELYPAFKDYDLKENYYLDSVSVFTPKEGYSKFYVYTSLDGVNFDLLAEKMDSSPCTEKGHIFNAKGKEARIIRVYLIYNSESVEAVINDIKFEGRKSKTPILEPSKIDIPNFGDSEFNIHINPEDTYSEVYGIIERRIGEEYKKWFEFSLSKQKEFDYFRISQKENKILIEGNNGVSLAFGLNYYLKYFCKVNISQVGDRVVMPETLVEIKTPVYKETKAKIRYAYNYCTLSYSMAFWGEKEWRRELDWLALNGVNVVLDATAQEEVWRRFLTDLGYTHAEIKKYITGPAYYAWAYMANIFGFGGPVHDNWFSERTHLARKNQLAMRKLGIYPILQGYSGMVPVDITDHCPEAVIIPQGTWGSFVRPFMLKTTSHTFRSFAEKFYKAQREVYGDYSYFYATDPFHEGGNTAGMNVRNIASEVLGAMLNFDSRAQWIIQAWEGNPKSELLCGLSDVNKGREHALILDLYAEKLPRYKEGAPGKGSYGYSKEFDGTPWIYCMLNNFGGRLGLHGHLDNMQNGVPEAFNTCEKIAGIGITPEASENNPVLYEFFFEGVWQDDANKNLPEIDMDSWLDYYCERRYGADSQNCKKAWEILKNTVYKAELNNLGQGAPESVVNARPAMEIKAASTWGNAIVGYDKSQLEKAARLMLADYDSLKGSEGYIYDLNTVLQQVLSNKAQDCYFLMVDAFKNNDALLFDEKSGEFLKIARSMEKVTGSSRYSMLGKWIESAKGLAAGHDDFSKKLYEFNAKALITTWGAYNQARSLHDYSNRQWSGLIGSFYVPRWERWIENCKNELTGKTFEKEINWFDWEWNWIWQESLYPTEPNGMDLSVLGKEILG